VKQDVGSEAHGRCERQCAVLWCQCWVTR